MRQRLRVHAAIIFLLWPAVSILATALEMRALPYYTPTWVAAFIGGGAGLLVLAPDVLITGGFLIALSVAISTRYGVPAQTTSRLRLALEPLLLFLAIACGASIWYPAVLGHAAFSPVWWLPSGVLWAALVAVLLVGCRVIARQPLRFTAALAMVGILLPVPGFTAWRLWPSGDAPTIVLLGLDSISHTDDTEPLAAWTESNRGAWYQRAVTPGLMTNATWASILAGRPVREHAIFHTFQHLPADHATLVQTAKAAGYVTVSMFSDQLTSAVGTESGFDVDASGPIGWRQLVIPRFANSSLVLPLLRPLLPRGWSFVSPNHGGTFTFDLEREVHAITRSGQGTPTLTAAHLNYVHMPAYPRMVDLSWREWCSVIAAPADRLRDRTLNWQDEAAPTDPIPLRRWKIARLQHVVVDEMTDYVGAGGRLVLFSDHGDRVGLNLDTFIDPQYHHVILATFGLPVEDVNVPISLIDVGRLAGITTTRAEVAVDYALADEQSWPHLMKTVKLSRSGGVTLDQATLDSVFRRLRTHRPFSDDEE